MDCLLIGTVYEYTTGLALSNAHSSLVDVKAQTEVVLHEYYRNVFQRKACVKYFSEIFDNKTKNRIA